MVNVTQNSNDSLSQVFQIGHQGGLFATGVGLYFQSKGQDNVEVEIRTTTDGVPTFQTLPDARAVINTADINLPDADGKPSITKVNFDSPIYLRENESYALVISSDSPGNRLFVSQLGEENINSDNNDLISKRPYVGDFFISQNTKPFEIQPLLKLSFQLYKATFNVDSGRVTLPFVVDKRPTNNNPFEYDSNGNRLLVKCDNHCFTGGERVQFFKSEDTNGNLDKVIYDAIHTISRTSPVSTHSFYIDLGESTGHRLTTTESENNNFLDSENTYQTYISPPTIPTGRSFGGAETSIVMTPNPSADLLYLHSSDIQLSETTLDYSFTYETSPNQRSLATSITPNEDFQLNQRTTFEDFELQATLTTDNTNLTPVIDLEGMNKLLIQNTVASADEDSVANYITKPITLDTSADNIRIIFEGNFPKDTGINIKYRGSDISSDLSGEDYVDGGYSNNTIDALDIFTEREFNIDTSNTIGNFKTLQIRIEFWSENTAFVARLRNLRIVCTS